jgi:hypothetical protein
MANRMTMRPKIRAFLSGSAALCAIVIVARGPWAWDDSKPSLRLRASIHRAEARLLEGCGNASAPGLGDGLKASYHLGIASACTKLADLVDEPPLSLEALRGRSSPGPAPPP